jgi:2,6-dihydroxypyridine 3-monooxygenase
VNEATRVAVMGGSLGGLTAALVLRDIGCDVHVFERSTAELEARGAGIAVLDETIRYLVEHDIADISTVCTRTEWLRYLHANGTVRHERPHPYLFSSWNTIYRHLLDSFGKERYHLGVEVAAFDQDDDHVHVRFADASIDTFDMLVCADGISSAARTRLLPHVVAEYAGYVAWRGTVPEPHLSATAMRTLGDAITYQVLDASHVLVYPIPALDGAVEPGYRLANFVWYRNVAEGAELEDLLTDSGGRQRTASVPPGKLRPEHVVEARSFARSRLAPQIAEVVDTAMAPFVQVIYDIAVPRMAFGRICLIGDAAFAIRPHAAAGTAKAADDAWTLADAMASERGDVQAALDRWEQGRLEVGFQVLQRARNIGTRSQFDGTWDPGDPDLIFGLHGPGH